MSIFRLLEELVDKQADVNIQGVGGVTPLRLAFYRGHEEISAFLRQNGAV